MILKYYYYLKPFIPRRVQVGARKWLMENKWKENLNDWPISENIDAPPEGWQGWPDGKKFALVLTHDVEGPRGVKRCMLLADLEKSFGFRSSFNFVCEDYLTPDDLLNNLRSNQFEIGIHGLNHRGNPFRSRKVFRKQSRHINEYLKKLGAVGFRSPSMYHDLEMLTRLNIEYDASTFDVDPFEPQPDGVKKIFPFRVESADGRRGYVELPYTLPQDSTLFVFLKQDNIDIWKKKLDWIAEKGGMALLITHPDYMNFGMMNKTPDEYPAEMYKQFLDYVTSKYKGQYWHALPRDISRFWRTNHLKEEQTVGRRKRICMLAYSFYESDNRIMRYAEALANRGDIVDVIALQNEEAAKYEVIRNVHVYRIQKRMINEKSNVSYLLKLVLFLIRSFIFLSKRNMKNPYDVVHVHSVPDFEVFAALLPKLGKGKIILDIHDIVPEFYASKFSTGKESLIYKILVAVERLSIQFANHVIISNHIWFKTLTARSVRKDKCTTVLNYPDENIFYRRPRSRQDDKFIMMYPGTLGWHQGLDIAVKAFAKIRELAPQAEFHIYGRGTEKDKLDRLVAEHHLENRVFLEDPMPIDRMAEVMANADIGIVPKRNDPFGGEAFSTKILEFMSLGIPVVIAKTKIDSFYFNDSVAQFFEPESEEDLAKAILELIKNHERRESLKENALQFVEDFKWSRKKGEYFDLIDSLSGD